MIATGKLFFHYLNKYLSEAKKEILISTFKIDSAKGSEYKPLQKTLGLISKKAREKVQIKLIIPGPPDKSPIARQNFAQIWALRRLGVEIRTISGYQSLHAKVFVIDRRILALGSHNLTKGACRGNWEMSLFSIDNNHLNAVIKLFFEAWDKMS